PGPALFSAPWLTDFREYSQMVDMHPESPSSAAASWPGILVRNLSVTAPDKNGSKTLLHNLSFAIPSGSFVAVIGMSGCGKSTLIRALAGIQPVTGGKILLSGHPVTALKQEY